MPSPLWVVIIQFWLEQKGKRRKIWSQKESQRDMKCEREVLFCWDRRNHMTKTWEQHVGAKIDPRSAPSKRPVLPMATRKLILPVPWWSLAVGLFLDELLVEICSTDTFISAWWDHKQRRSRLNVFNSWLQKW